MKEFFNNFELCLFRYKSKRLPKQNQSTPKEIIFCTFVKKLKMKSLLTILAIILSATAILNAQESSRFQKYPISNTGCFAYFPSAPGAFDVQMSDDSLNVYTGEASFDNANYAVILVDFKENFKGVKKEELEGLVTGYLDFLQKQFAITGAAGYGMGHTLESNPNAVGVIDFWEDADGLKYSVKAWADEKTLAVLMVYSKSEVNYNISSLFLNGFRFKE